MTSFKKIFTESAKLSFELDYSFDDLPKEVYSEYDNLGDFLTDKYKNDISIEYNSKTGDYIYTTSNSFYKKNLEKFLSSFAKIKIIKPKDLSKIKSKKEFEKLDDNEKIATIWNKIAGSSLGIVGAVNVGTIYYKVNKKTIYLQTPNGYVEVSEEDIPFGIKISDIKKILKKSDANKM